MSPPAALAHRRALRLVARHCAACARLRGSAIAPLTRARSSALLADHRDMKPQIAPARTHGEMWAYNSSRADHPEHNRHAFDPVQAKEPRCAGFCALSYLSSSSVDAVSGRTVFSRARPSAGMAHPVSEPAFFCRSPHDRRSSRSFGSGSIRLAARAAIPFSTRHRGVRYQSSRPPMRHPGTDLPRRLSPSPEWSATYFNDILLQVARIAVTPASVLCLLMNGAAVAGTLNRTRGRPSHANFSRLVLESCARRGQPQISRCRSWMSWPRGGDPTFVLPRAGRRGSSSRGAGLPFSHQPHRAPCAAGQARPCD